ncbi:MAG: hypothetical protein K2K15_02060 [Anaeroplasmataceae bacterium]|nr:hypothetical protein [Anaeroplasmataceae bacterium]
MNWNKLFDSHTIKKIKIVDNDELRNEIDKIYSSQNQISLAKWSLELAKHIIELTHFDTNEYPEIQEGFNINELWQKGKAKMHEVRQSSFKIHRIAREQSDELLKTIFRFIGHAVASGHMKEHSMVASDYAVKVINLLYNNDLEKVKEERTWQLDKLKESQL